MKSNIKLIELKGVTTPNLSEPIGEEFKKVMNEISLKVEEKRELRSNSVNKINELNTKLTKLNNQLLMAEDEFEELEIRKKIKEVKGQLENTEDYSGLDVGEYARKLINNPKVQQPKEDAEKEYLSILKVAKVYKDELDKQYNQSIKEINKFIAGYQSNSTYFKANVRYNSYKDR